LKLSFTTLGCPDWSLAQIEQNAKAYGYKGVELRVHTDGNHLSPDINLTEAKRIGQRFRDSGVPIFSTMGYCRFAKTDPAEVLTQQALMRKLFGVAEALGSKYIRFFCGNLPAGTTLEAMTDVVARAVKPLAHEAGQRGLKLVAETHDDWCGSPCLLKLSSQINEPAGFGFVYDVFNCLHANLESWETTYFALKAQIVYCHVKDAWFDAAKKHHYVPLGAGDLPLELFLRRLKQDGYDSWLSFEWEKKWISELDPPEKSFPQYVHKMRRVWDSI
jgi:sugar phosphate isomerase/epimerase